MAEITRKTIGFSAREVDAIAEVLNDSALAEALDSELLGGLRATPIASIAEEPVSSFADAVRRLTALGVTQLRRARLEEQYRQIGDLGVPGSEELSAMGRSTMRALDDLVDVGPLLLSPVAGVEGAAVADELHA